MQKIYDLPLVDESIESVGKSAQNYLKRHPLYLISAIVLTIGFFAVLIFTKGELLFLFILPLFFLIFLYLDLVSRIQHEFMRQFAAINSFSYMPKGTLDGLSGIYFSNR